MDAFLYSFAYDESELHRIKASLEKVTAKNTAANCDQNNPIFAPCSTADSHQSAQLRINDGSMQLSFDARLEDHDNDAAGILHNDGPTRQHPTIVSLDGS